MSLDGFPQSLEHRLRAFITDPQAITDLRRYFGVELPHGAGTYTGSRFEHLAGGGEQPGTADRITAEDLVAVETLSVSIPVRVKLDLLEGPLGAQMADLLPQIPSGVDLACVDASVVADGSPADKAWGLLEAPYGMGWVIAGKILARKRPRLLPVYDKVVRCALGRPRPFWTSLHAVLRNDGNALHHQLLALRQTAGLPDTVSALRVCDVSVWMSHRAVRHACR